LWSVKQERDNEQTGARREEESEVGRGDREERGRKEGRAVVVIGRRKEERVGERERKEKGVGDDAAARAATGSEQRVWQERVWWTQQRKEARYG
jgi:hypothetical protein